jgi:hypothetical protein
MITFPRWTEEGKKREDLEILLKNQKAVTASLNLPDPR